MRRWGLPYSALYGRSVAILSGPRHHAGSARGVMAHRAQDWTPGDDWCRTATQGSPPARRSQPDAATTEAPGSDPAETAPTSEPEAAPDEPAPTSWQLIRVARLRDRTGADDEEYPRLETRAEADELHAKSFYSGTI